MIQRANVLRDPSIRWLHARADPLELLECAYRLLVGLDPDDHNPRNFTIFLGSSSCGTRQHGRAADPAMNARRLIQ
jgi:hypothetical protein